MINNLKYGIETIKGKKYTIKKQILKRTKYNFEK